MAGNHVLLETISLTQNAASVTFDNIPQSGYTDLKIVVSARTARASNGDYVLLSFNGAEADSARGLWAYGTTVVSDSTTNNGLIVPGNNATASTFGNLEVYCPNYTSSTNKSISIDASSEDNTSGSNGNKISTFLWSSGSASAAAVTSITLAGRFASFLSGSTFSLYGVADVNTTPVTAPLATGDNIVANDGTYWYHAFLSSGTFVPQTALTCDILQIAGGGGGGQDSGGGGGAGGLLYSTSQSMGSGTSYTITVGAGGVGSISYAGAAKGGNSSVAGSGFATLTAIGGGAGKRFLADETTANGGSGGGSSGGQTQSAGTGTAGQGNNGGTGIANGPNYPGGGGGGAGAVGGNASLPDGNGSGGVGSSTYSSWGLATSTGQNVSGTYYYAGGGGGTNGSATPGLGGYGGGGAGRGTSGPGISGTVNTGGGGGGGSSAVIGQGGTGGSGIVIIRYPIA